MPEKPTLFSENPVLCGILARHVRLHVRAASARRQAASAQTYKTTKGAQKTIFSGSAMTIQTANYSVSAELWGGGGSYAHRTLKVASK
jgi:hypothetical protein